MLQELEERLVTAGLMTVSYKPDTASYAPSVARNKVLPPSLASLPESSLERQAYEASSQWQELDEYKKEIKLHKAAGHAHTLLDTEYLTVDPRWQTPGYRKLSLSSKLIALRTAQARERDSAEETIRVTAVIGVATVPGPDLTHQTYHLPANISWARMQAALTRMTLGWQAREAGYPHGYTLEHGKWLYSDGKAGTMVDLATEGDLAKLRKRLRQGEDRQVVVWHERLWDKWEAARIEAGEDREAESERDDWLTQNGWEVWDPFNNPDHADFDRIDFGGEPTVLETDTEMARERLTGVNGKGAEGTASPPRALPQHRRVSD